MNTMFTFRDIRAAADAAGSHFFDRDTMRFFRSRLCGRVYTSPRGSYFVTSERGPHGARRYSVRLAAGEGDTFTIDTVGTFQQYATRTAALNAAKRLAVAP